MNVDIVFDPGVKWSVPSAQGLMYDLGLTSSLLGRLETVLQQGFMV